MQEIKTIKKSVELLCDDSEHFIEVSSNVTDRRKQQEDFAEQINLRHLPVVDFNGDATAVPCTCIDGGSLKESLIKSVQTGCMYPEEC